MYNLVNIIQEASLYFKSKFAKLRYIKENYPEYYNAAKSLINKNDNLVNVTSEILNNSIHLLDESCSNKETLETENYMSDYFGTNKELQNLVNYLNSYEIYNLEWNDSEPPINKPDKLYKQVEKQRKNKETKLVNDYNSLEKNLNNGNYYSIKGLVTEYIGYCPKCKQIAFPNHKCQK